jgi:UDP-2-acetamido-2-deoxy-ribo-hexuluronate aminotransferase
MPLLALGDNMQFIDLKSQYKDLKSKIDSNIQTVLDHGQYIMGPEVTEIEKNLAEFAGSKYCVSCASGTDALVMALLAHEIGKGDFVITTPFTFIATGEAIAFVGATPLFVDIDQSTFNICPDKLEQMLSSIKDGTDKIHNHLCTDVSKIKAIMPVDLFGLPANYDRINPIAKEYNLINIEDAAQGFGGELNGIKAGNLGDIGCTSFFPAKPLGCYGDGGAIFTNDESIYEKLKSIRVHGQGSDKYENVRMGLTGRLDTIQAAVLLPKLAVFDSELNSRRAAADQYNSELMSVQNLIKPVVPSGYKSAWAQYTLMAKDENHRQKIIDKLKENGIPSAIYYVLSLHEQKVFLDLGYGPNDFPVSSNASNRVFSLPMHPYLASSDIIKICKLIQEV